MSTNAHFKLTLAQPMPFVQTRLVHFNVNAAVAMQAMEDNALTSMNAWQELTVVVLTQPA